LFAQRSPDDLAADALGRPVAGPNLSRTAPLRFTLERFGSVPRSYIECLHDRITPIEGQRRMQALPPCGKVISLEAGHSPFLSAPDALAEALLALAEGSIGAGWRPGRASRMSWRKDNVLTGQVALCD
jgi:pimeloyl-ACP methyl ester carboxylesterase